MSVFAPAGGHALEWGPLLGWTPWDHVTAGQCFLAVGHTTGAPESVVEVAGPPTHLRAHGPLPGRTRKRADGAAPKRQGGLLLPGER